MAFIAMNIPFTMNVTQAASAIREFQPLVYKKQQCKNGERKSGKKAM
jgi:hypothetical protein